MCLTIGIFVGKQFRNVHLKRKRMWRKKEYDKNIMSIHLTSNDLNFVAELRANELNDTTTDRDGYEDSKQFIRIVIYLSHLIS